MDVEIKIKNLNSRLLKSFPAPLEIRKTIQ